MYGWHLPRPKGVSPTLVDLLFHRGVATILLEHNSDVNASNSQGSTALTLAAEKGHGYVQSTICCVVLFVFVEHAQLCLRVWLALISLFDLP